MPKSEPWDGKWIRGEKLEARSGQSHVFMARRRDQTKDSCDYVLKVLKHSDVPLRRQRMAVEYSFLTECDHPGIVRVFDSNSADITAERLYTVVEYLPGGTLAERIGEQTLGLSDAVELVQSLVTTIDYYRQVTGGGVHRDIKPDNIMFRNSDSWEPVLIDFGLGFNPKLAVELETESGERLGNGFITMPELQPGKSGLRSIVSDLTQCVGILYYALTGLFPGVLVDAENKKPHRRDNGPKRLGNVAGSSLERLNIFFDRGFSWIAEKRFVSVESLLSGLDDLAAPQPVRKPLGEWLSEVRSETETDQEIAIFRNATKAIGQFDEALSDMLRGTPFDAGIVDLIVFSGITKCDMNSTIPSTGRRIMMRRANSLVQYVLAIHAAREGSVLRVTVKMLDGSSMQIFAENKGATVVQCDDEQYSLTDGVPDMSIVRAFVEDRLGAAIRWLIMESK